MPAEDKPHILLKVICVIFIASGVFNVVLGILAIGSPFTPFAIEVPFNALSLFSYGALSLATGISEFLAGFLGLKARYRLGSVFAWVNIVLSTLTMLMAILSSSPMATIASTFISLAVPVLYFFGIQKSIPAQDKGPSKTGPFHQVRKGK